MNLLEHSGHSNLFSPVCVLLCLWSSSLRVNLLPQNIQLQMKGLSPVCQRRCARRWEVLPYTLPHPSMWQTCCFFFPGSLLPLPSPSLQLGHEQATLRSLLPGCTSASEVCWPCCKCTCVSWSGLTAPIVALAIPPTATVTGAIVACWTFTPSCPCC